MQQTAERFSIGIKSGPERGTASFSPRNSKKTKQLTIEFTPVEKRHNMRTEAMVQRQPPDEIITRESCNGIYQQFFDFLLDIEPRDSAVAVKLKHDLELRKKVEARLPRCDEVYKLRKILEQVGHFYGVETEHVAIGWFHGRNGKTTIQLGYVLLDEDVILINEKLNTLPRYVVEAIVAHELCHLLVPPIKKNGRLMRHHTKFKQHYMLHPSAKLYERHHNTIHAFLFN